MVGFGVPALSASQLLHAAALGDKEEVCRILVEDGADIDIQNSSGSTCCHIAAKKRYVGLLEILVEQDADLNIEEHRSVGGFTPLFYAVEENDARVAEFLLENDADPNLHDAAMRFTPLHHCARKGLNDMAELLVNYGADGNLRDKEGCNASYWAREMGNEDFLKIAGIPPPAAMTAEERFEHLKAIGNPPKGKKGGKKKGKKGGKKKGKKKKK